MASSQKPNIAIILIIQNDFLDFLDLILQKLYSQKKYFLEIILVNSGREGPRLFAILKNYSLLLNIKYVKIPKSYPGHARNAGVRSTNAEWLAFLDAKTVPSNVWLIQFYKDIISQKYDFLYCSGRAVSLTKVQTIIMMASYGSKVKKMLPGSIVSKKLFLKSKGFNSSVRSSEDIEWIIRVIKLGARIKGGNYPLIEYFGIPKSMFSAYNKYLIYSFNTALTLTFFYQKMFYFLVILLGVFAHINTEIYTINLFGNKTSLFWIYILVFFVSVITFRGLIRPIKDGQKYKYLIPFRWILIGVMGLILDLAKIPGYTFGALNYPIIRFMKWRRGNAK